MPGERYRTLRGGISFPNFLYPLLSALPTGLLDQDELLQLRVRDTNQAGGGGGSIQEANCDFLHLNTSIIIMYIFHEDLASYSLKYIYIYIYPILLHYNNNHIVAVAALTVGALGLLSFSTFVFSILVIVAIRSVSSPKMSS